MKILVTGGSGQLGRELKELIPNAIYVSSKDYDLTKCNDVKLMFENHKPDVVIHAAAKVGGIMDNLKYPVEYYYENVMMNSLVVQTALEFGVTKFIGILSTCIYPDIVDSYPMKESVLHDGKPTYTNFSYGISKRGMAVHLDTIREHLGLEYSYIIPCNLYGRYDKFDERSHFVGALLQKILDAEKQGSDYITLFGTGKPLRQFLYATDLAKVVKNMIDSDVYESFNMATEENISIDEIANITLNELGLSDKIKIKYDSSKPDGQFRKDVDISEFKKHFPDFKFTPLGVGIREVYERLKELK